MAQQLLAHGQKVALLALIATAPPRPVSFGANVSVSKKSLGHYIFRSIYHLQNGQLIRTTGNLLRKQYNKIARISIPRRIRKIRDVMEMAPWSYVPQIYPGRITYLLSEKRKRASDNPRDAVGAWYDLAADGIDITAIPGDHFSIWKEPNVQAIAEKLKACLDLDKV
jgi:aspartate racemase